MKRKDPPRYEAELRARLIASVARRREGGRSLSGAASKLAMPMNTVARWVSRAKRSTALETNRSSHLQNPDAGPSLISCSDNFHRVPRMLALKSLPELIHLTRR